ncbi:DUF423 domain-containing protein [Marinomonas sp. A79]|uniref:DUF423 domain-containing protein n=1 Tax=Marinomonas vulgaris TaxID=2823372 RepID=A0ABS5H7H2_9GAMM|nr:DUF423 domain-containing protein [Marinomonas vulgaris]MBR7887668.1 DUF423 domain-containing protein [Marinomonas vulgaris]
MNAQNLSINISKWAAVFAFQAALSVAAGAFGAHALKSMLDSQALGWWSTGSQYLMYHSLAGLVVALAVFVPKSNAVLLLFCLGNVLFAGSLYTMALTGVTVLGAVTPLGGVCYLSAWLLLVVKLWRMAAVKA